MAMSLLSVLGTSHPSIQREDMDPAVRIDLGRRKQKHPRPISVSSEGGEVEEGVGSSPTRDLSDMVKVEIHQTEEEAETERRPSPTSPRSNSQHGLPFPPMEDLMRKCNLVPFGEVTIQNHPNTPPIPMTIPITYLFPISKDPATGEAKYKMLVPRNGAEMGMGFPPMIPFPSPPLMPQMAPPPNFRPEETTAEQQKVKILNKKPKLLQEVEKGAQQLKVEVKEAQETSSSPLDLTHRSPNSLASDQEEESQAKSPRTEQSAPGTRSPEQKLGPEIEAQLNFLKVKQMEFLKQAAEQSVNRCNECNINFSKYQNYLAHKKYYCNGLKGQAPDSDEDSTQQQGQAKLKTLSPSGAPSSSSSSPPFSSTSPAPANKTIFSREFFQKSLLDAPKLPPGLLLAPGALPPPQPSSHFVCQGCGIKFKSISNLQAHQSRYCAGIKTPEEVNVHQPPGLEALLKSGLGQLPIQGMSAADMMSFLSAQQALKAEAKEGRLVEENTEARSPKGEGEDFCCILCGFKESSVDKLKDHINMHFIGQVKKRKSENEGSLQGEEMADKENRQEVLVKRIKVEGKQQEEENGEVANNTEKDLQPPIVKESQTALTCTNCNISFVNPSTYSAHVQFYCKKKNDPV